MPTASDAPVCPPQVLRVLRPGALEASRRAVPSALTPPGASGTYASARPQDMMGRAKQLGIGELQTPQPRKEGCVNPLSCRKRQGLLASCFLPLWCAGCVICLLAPAVCRCRALLPSAAGPLLWAGSDRTIRCWDSAKPQQSIVVCAAPPPIPAPLPAHLPSAAVGGPQAAVAAAAEGGSLPHVSVVDVPRYEYGQRSVGGVPVVEEFCTLERSAGGGPGSRASGGAGDAHHLRLGWAERAAAQCHQQPVLDLARVDSTSTPVLLSCGQDGVIKAWK